MMSLKKKELSEHEKKILLQKIQKDLPNNWIVRFSTKYESRVYFFNTLDGCRSWKHPCYIENKEAVSTTRKAQKRKSDETLKTSKAHKNVHKKVQSNITEHGGDRAGQVETGVMKKKVKKNKQDYKRKKFCKAKDDLSSCKFRHKCDDKVTNERPATLPSELSEASTSTRGDHAETKILNTPTPTESFDDVEMLDLSVGDKFPHVSGEVKQSKAFVIDTNVLLDKASLSILESVVRPASKSKPSDMKFVVPWVVLQELDNLKKNKTSARQAISFLNRHFQEKKSVIRGQSIFQAATVIDGLKVESNDDRILQCCFSVQRSSAKNVPVLVTKDKNLMNKALTLGFECLGNVSGLYDVNHRRIIKSNQEKDVQHEHMPHAQNSDKNNNQAVISQPFSICIKNDLLLKCQKLLLSALSCILEKEMKAAYDCLWLDVILHKPPWTLSNVLRCMQKHWLPVFGMMGVDRLVQIHLERLITLQGRITAPQRNKDPELAEWVHCAENLLLGICQVGKYDPCVKDALAALQTISSSIVSDSLDKESKEVQQQNNCSLSEMQIKKQEITDEKLKECIDTPMSYEAVDSCVFWNVLNHIWTSIISHCGMLFQGLNFTPSHAYDAPEVHQALQASFDFIPPRAAAVHALPLITEFVRSIYISIEKLLHCNDCKTDGWSATFLDLLYTLGTAVQAFSVDCDIFQLMKLQSQISTAISESYDMIERLKIGFQQLCIVVELLKECENFVMKGNGFLICARFLYRLSCRPRLEVKVYVISMDEPQKRSGHVAVTFRKWMFVWGGYDDPGYVSASDFWIYDLNKRTWFQKQASGELPPGTSGSCAALVDSSLFIFAGCTRAGDISEVYELDLLSLVWTKRQVQCQTPSERNKLSCWVLGGKIIFFGGYGKKPSATHIGHGRFALDQMQDFDILDLGWNNDLLAYDTEKNEWEALPVHENAASPRAAHACAKLNSSVGYVFGGRHKDRRLDDLHSIQFGTWMWTAINPQCEKPEGRSWHSFTQVDSRNIFLFGGLTTEGYALDDAWLFDATTMEWKAVEHRNSKRMWHTACTGAFKGQVVVFGGSTGIFGEPAHSNVTMTFELNPTPLLRLALRALMKYRKETWEQWHDLPRELRAELCDLSRGG